MDWLLLSCLVLFSVLLLAPRAGESRRRTFVLAAVVFALAAVGAWAWNSHNRAALVNAKFTDTKLPHLGRREAGYVSSDRCAACHPDQYQSWHHSFHRTMTQIARPDTVRAAFTNIALTLDGKAFRLEQRGSEFWAEMEDPYWAPGRDGMAAVRPRVWKRIGLLTGSHHMQVFWVPPPPELPSNLQVAFPFTYLFEDQRWVPLRDTFLKDPSLPPANTVWNGNCLECHTTGGQPKMDRTTGRVDTRVAELGISCEACHGPGDDHIRANSNPLRRYLLHRAGKPDPTIVNPSRLDPKAASQVCGQCHSIKWFLNHKDWVENGFRYRPGGEISQTMPVIQPTRLSEQPWLAPVLKRDHDYLPDHYWPDGQVRVSGRDYNGLIDSPCYQKGDLTCLSCHSMHQSQPENQVAKSMESNEACLQCHTKMRANVAAHTHHAADSSGSLCYDCHMPRTTYGLLKAIRNHFIESPNVAVSAAIGRPNGCNLCHLDRSLGWVDQHLTNWFGTKPATLTEEQKTTSAALLWALRGDAGQRALAAWHMGWEPALRASGRKWEPIYLAQLLADPYPAVRYIALRSLKSAQGFEHFKFDFSAPPDQQADARFRALLQCQSLGPPDRISAELLQDEKGGPQLPKILSLLRERDNKSIDLQE